MSSVTDADRISSMPSTATYSYKSVASMEKIHVAHDIVISDFADWRRNVELLGPVDGTLDIPIPNDEDDVDSEVY